MMLASTLRHYSRQNLRRWASTLVISDPLNGSVTPPSTQSAVTAAKALGNDVELLTNTLPTEIPEGVSKVYYGSFPNVETMARAIESLKPDVVVGTSTKFGSTVIPYAAGLLDASPITDIIAIESEGTCLNGPLSGFLMVDSLYASLLCLLTTQFYALCFLQIPLYVPCMPVTRCVRFRPRRKRYCPFVLQVSKLLL